MTSVPQLAPEGSVIDAAAAVAATGVDEGTAGTRSEGTVEPPSTALLDTSAGVREADVDADKLDAEGAVVDAELARSVPSVATGAKRKGGKSGGSKGKKRSKVVVAGGGELAANGDTPYTVTRPTATLPQPHEEGFLASCMKCIQNNMGAYKRGEWEREPWAARPYATVGDYQIPPDVPAEDGANLLQKLACSLPHNWVGEDVRNVLKLHRATGPVSIDFSMDEPLKVGVDLRLCDLWGIDCHTRTAICDVLRHLPDFYEASTRERFIEHALLPAANASGARGWDILAALSRVEEDAKRTEDSAQLSAVQALTKVVRELDEKAPSDKPPSNGKKGNKPSPPPPSEATDPPPVPAVGTEEVAPDVDPATKRRSFRLHPKGQGVVCMRESGVAEGTLVSAYYGDIYPSWRWYERQDALKKANPNSDLPDFYNITMERPSEDPRGYDVLFIDGAMKGTFASRLSHSCAPNCVNIPIIRNDRLEIHMYTCRRVEYGEELCWDYACVTESEKEWAAAICLCGSSKCRGSFLYYAGTTAFAEFLNAKHGFLERNAMLARAVMEPLTESDTIRLAEFGIKDSALTNVTGERIPNWLIKWASLATECISEEEAFITAFLEAHPKYKYTAESAAVEAKGVKANRIFNIVTTLDKIKYCMRNQKGEAGSKPPLVPLKPREVCEYLWSSPQSIARRCVEAASRFISPASGGSKKRGQTAAGKSTAGAELVGLQELLAEELTSPSKVYAALQQLSVVLRAMGPQHNAMADLLMMYSSTRSWFRAVSLETFKSPPVSFEGDDRVPPNLQRVEQGSDAEKFLSRRYTGQYCWGQLVSWFKQTIYNPEASLSADRRGTMSLPDPESAYSNPRGYNSKERQQLLNLIEKSPNKYFPTSFIWSFKNPAKIYGSPQLDAAIANALGQESRLPKLLQQLRSATR